MGFVQVRLCDSWGSGEHPDAVYVVTRDGEGLRYVPERTCRVVRSGKPSSTGVPSESYCSECGNRLSRFGSYCSNCGARIERSGDDR